jgi:hypothetical protein
LRESAEFRAAKRQRPGDGERWSLGGCTNVVSAPQAGPQAFTGLAGTSDYFEGSIAIGIVFVSGPGDLAITEAEKTKFVAEAKEGLDWYRTVAPSDLGLRFVWETRTVPVTDPPKDVPEDLPKREIGPYLEKVWLDPALKVLQEATPMTYVENLRTLSGTRWAYCAFVTKYPLAHRGYAVLNGPYLVMDTEGSGHGRDNIDRVFAHETGHIFGAPDEYDGSPCSCGDTFGRFDVPNGNCETWAAGSVDCVMKSNTSDLCGYTPAHLGWEATGPLLNCDTNLVVDISGGSKGDGTPAFQLP